MKFSKLAVFSALILYSNSSFSGSYICSGKVDNFFIARDGSVELYSAEIYSNGNGRKLCNTSTIWKGVSPDTCKSWVSTILAQIAQKKPTKVYYLIVDAANCSATLTYESAPSPWGVSEN